MARIFVLLILFALTCFLIFLAVLSSQVKRLKKLEQIDLAKRQCPKCGKPIGATAASQSELAYIAEMDQVWKDNPGMRFSIAAIWPVTCPGCGWKGKYEPAKKELLNDGVVVE